MVSKKCPDCDQTLPVACKSCPCGHVFISKKQSSPQEKADNGDGGQRDQRLRPEVPKIASKDFDYHYGARLDRNQELLSEKQLINRIVIPQPPKPVHPPQISQPSTSETHMVVGAISIENNQPISMSEMRLTESPTIGEGDIIARRKRGRPKGSKNKPKPIIPISEETSSQDDSQNTESGDPGKRKRGRPKGSKNKPKDPLLAAFKDEYVSDGPDDYYQEPYIDHMPHISKEKAISYSIVLSDINQKMMKQSSMNFIK